MPDWTCWKNQMKTDGIRKKEIYSKEIKEYKGNTVEHLKEKVIETEMEMRE